MKTLKAVLDVNFISARNKELGVEKTQKELINFWTEICLKVTELKPDRKWFTEFTRWGYEYLGGKVDQEEINRFNEIYGDNK